MFGESAFMLVLKVLSVILGLDQRGAACFVGFACVTVR